MSAMMQKMHKSRPGRTPKDGFTLVEVILVLALMGLVAAALVPLFGLMFRIQDNAAKLADVQTAAETQMLLIEQQLRYASGLSIESGLPGTDDEDHVYLYWSDGQIFIKKPGSAPASLPSGGYTYKLTFSAADNSRVLRADLTVYQSGKRLHQVHSDIYSENLTGSIAGAGEGTAVAILP